MSSSSLKAGLAMSPKPGAKAASRGSPSLKQELANKMAELHPSEEQPPASQQKDTEKAATAAPDANGPAKAVAKEASKEASCPAGHTLTLIAAKADSKGDRVCNSCSTNIEEGQRHHTCSSCDYDLCTPCLQKAEQPEAPSTLAPGTSGDLTAMTTARNALVKSARKACSKQSDVGPRGSFEVTCHQGHKVTSFPAPDDQRVCNLCSSEIAQGESLNSCGACDFDLCEPCVAKESRVPPAGTAAVEKVEKSVAAVATVATDAQPVAVKEAAAVAEKVSEKAPAETAAAGKQAEEKAADKAEEDEEDEEEEEEEEEEDEEEKKAEDEAMPAAEAAKGELKASNVAGSEGEEKKGEVEAPAETEVAMEGAPDKKAGKASKASKASAKKESKKARKKALQEEKRAGGLKPATASRDDNLTYDLRHMAAYDIAPQSVLAKEADFLEYSRDSVQMLVNKLFSLGKTRGEDGMTVDLPTEVVFRMPRQKPIPKEKVKTRWEKFMEERGMKKRKRSRLVFDEVSGDWKPRWGYKSVKKSQEAGEHAIYEMKAGEDPNSNPFERMKTEKKLQKMKQKMREVRNKVEAAGGKLRASVPDLNKEAKRGKDGLREVLKRAQVSTGSRGKFDRTANNEPTNLQTKRQKPHGPLSGDKEKERYMKFAGKVLSGQTLDKDKAAKVGRQQAEGTKVGRKDKAKGSKGTPGKGRRSKQTQKKAARSSRGK